MTLRERQRQDYLETEFFHEHDMALTKDQFHYFMETPYGFYGDDLETLEEFIIANAGNIRYGWKILTSGSTYKLQKKF